MATGPFRGVLEDLRRAVLAGGAAELSDTQLLECYLSGRENAAFAALVRRHGPMVLGVCRRVLGNRHDAEDAFQATFLVLTRKAASIAKREQLSAWLYGVAYRIAMRAKSMSAKRRVKEREAGGQPRGANSGDPLMDQWNELESLLDREVSRLPKEFQAPIVLCDLRGASRKEAALQLGLPEGTLSSRLARGRELLRQRLARQGVTLTATSLPLALAQHAGAVPVSPALLQATVKAAQVFGAGAAAAAGALPSKVVLLAEGAIKALLLSRLNLVLALAVGLGSLGLVVSAAVGGVAPANAAPPAAARHAGALRPDGGPRPAGVAHFAFADRPVTAPPADLVADPFYRKHLDADGVAVLGSSKVSDRALREAARVLDGVLHTRPDLRAALARSDTRFVVMHPTEVTTDFPEQADLRPKSFWDRSRGFGDRLWNCGEENLLNLPGDPHHGESVLVHQLAASLYFKAHPELGKDFDRRLRQHYHRAVSRGQWKGLLGPLGHVDYWARGVQAYFDCGPALAHTREDLFTQDRGLFHHIDGIFRHNSWRYRIIDLTR